MLAGRTPGPRPAPAEPTMINAPKFKSWIPHGFDFLTPEASKRLIEFQQRFREEFAAAGYREVIPPMLDYAPTFQLTTRTSQRGPIFATRDSDGEELSVRSDLTVQVIKAAAHSRLGTDFPLRVCYLQPVFQDRPWGSGHRREIMQGGVEIVGASPDRFQDLLGLARRCLERAGSRPRILYGDVRFLEALFRMAPADEKTELSAAFHNKDRERIRQICERADVPAEVRPVFMEVPLLFGGPDTLQRLLELCRDFPELTAYLKEAEQLADVVYDFSLVRELSYYSGPVFEAYIPETKHTVLTGGIYDDLYGQFADRERPACGFAFNLSVLAGLI